ncbi:hypothetical protein [Salinactinospora qingdaonensis]|uniref:Uncharacterized protein n=1 Tax=Salinactinospora qingdaonensis TaxID=702744 RepID=A0ABP7EV41_9ACTN
MPPSVTHPPPSAFTTTVVEVIEGGEPDEYGVSLSGMRPPHRLSYCGPQCPCASLGIFYELWEHLEKHDLYSRDTTIWLRTLAPDEDEPLPPGARVVNRRTVTLAIT